MCELIKGYADQGVDIVYLCMPPVADPHYSVISLLWPLSNFKCQQAY